MKFNASNEHVATVDFDLVTAICVIAQLQLAARHPKNIGPSREVAEVFARSLQQKIIEVAPENAAIMEMGWNPDFDIG
jgi:hypothetical protein